MSRVVRLALTVMLFCAFPAADHAFACTCVSGFAFATYTRTDEVFTGRVVSITRDPTSEYHREIVRVQVLESLKGTASGEVQVISGAVCGFPFEQGREYLIYASPEAEGLTTDLCNRTRMLDAATVDLAYIRGLREGRSGANVYGLAERERPADAQPAIREQVRIRMILSGTGGRFETVLDEGKFEFHFVPAGTYKLSAVDAVIVSFMSSRSGRGTVVREITVDSQTDVSDLGVILRIRGD